MSELTNGNGCLIEGFLIGVGATLFMDLCMLARKTFFDIELPSYGMVGRWLSYCAKGQFFHSPIQQSPAVKGEILLGWMAHYSVGIGFGLLLLSVVGSQWLQAPTFLPALLMGLVTLLAPFCVMQPGMGAGIAACKTPYSWRARLQSVITHSLFGFGLYLTAVLLLQTR